MVMGFTLPSSTSSMERARALMEAKKDIEAEIEAQISILKANSSTMQTPLVDADGFPRADIDIYAVREARVRIIHLRNDLKGIIDDIGKALEVIYDPNLSSSTVAQAAGMSEQKPFAKVNDVAPESPAKEAGLQPADLVLKFGNLDHKSFPSSSLQPLADLVSKNEDHPIPVKVLRNEQTVSLTLTPRQGWGGRGMLGCHIVPYTKA